MQTPVEIAIYQTILAALVIQFFMILINRRARDAYITDITHFRTPKNPLSRYYKWRVTRLGNAILDAIVFLSVLVSVVLVLAYYSSLLPELLNAVVIVAFVLGLAGLSSAQMVWRVKQVNEKERDLVMEISSSVDIISKARVIVDDLYSAKENSDGHTWFALFRIAQLKDPLGYSVRDVLLEKGKSVILESEEKRIAKAGMPTSETDGLDLE